MAVSNPLTTVNRIAIVTDSRGQGLQEELNRVNLKGYTIKVFVKKGCGIAQAVRETSKSLVWMAPDIIIVLAGICDVTQLNRSQWTVSLQDEDINCTIDGIVGCMDATRHHLSIVLTEKPHRIIFGHIVGMDIAKFNRSEQKHPQQDTLDEMITQVNHHITAFNKENAMLTPWTSQDIHRNKKGGRKTTRYYKLAEDGLHLSNEIREKWAAIIYNVIVKTHQELTKGNT